MHRFEIELSDVDRGVYEQLELRAAQHPSETMSYLLTRVIAYCLRYEEGIAFSHGLAAADEPAVWVKDLQGNLTAWIEVGTPSAARLHKATKAVPRVAVYTHHDVELLKKSVRGKGVHRVAEIEVVAVDRAFLDALAALTDRSNAWTLVRNDAEIYLSAKERTLTTRIAPHTLADSSAAGSP
jgi:uncharacterized protein YaeQ